MQRGGGVDKYRIIIYKVFIGLFATTTFETITI